LAQFVFYTLALSIDPEAKNILKAKVVLVILIVINTVTSKLKIEAYTLNKL